MLIKVSDDIIAFQDKVLEWNNLFGNSVTNKDLIEDYRNYTLEEVGGKNELVYSAIKGDEEGVLDAICDVIYTGFMYLALNGKQFSQDAAFADISSSMSDMSAGVAMKLALEKKDVDKFQLYLINYLNYAKSKFYIKKAFSRVTESNFSKAFVLKDGETSHDLYKYKEAVEKAGRYQDIFFEYHDGRYIAKAKTDLRENKTYSAGKIVKSDYWFKSVEALGGLKEFIK